MAIIKPYSPENTGRILKWFDSFVKKTIMISGVVFFYDYPTVACIVLGSIGVIDTVVTARDLTGVPLLNCLIF